MAWFGLPALWRRGLGEGAIDFSACIGVTSDGQPILLTLDGFLGPVPSRSVEILSFLELPANEAIHEAMAVVRRDAA